MAALAAFGGTAAAHASFTQEPGSPVATNGTDTLQVLAADFNADARPDLAAINGTSSDVSLLLRQPGGGFVHETGSPFALGAGGGGASYATLSDFNGDGRTDIAVPAFVGLHVTVLQRQGGGGFAQENPPFNAGQRLSGVGAGDFNGDGRIDVAAAQWDFGSVRILQRATPGGFTDGGSLATGTQPRFVAVADFNGDGDPDLAIPNAGSGSVSVLLGGAGHSFAAESAAYPVGSAAQLAAAQDFNGDGRPDVAVTSVGTDSVTLLLRQPGGGFAVQPPIAVGTDPVGVSTADFNLDGRPDLAVANQGSHNVSVLLQSASGAFTPDPSSPVPAGQGASTVAVADFNADARPDMAVSNADNRVTTLLNTSPFPSAPTVDADGDGVSPPADCNDSDPSIRPGVTDRPGDRVDQDCNGADAGADVGLPMADRKIVAKFVHRRGYSRFKRLLIRPVRRGDRIRLTCRGRGCRKRNATVRVRQSRRKLSILRHMRRAKLRRRAVVEVRLTRSGALGVMSRWKIRAPRKPKRTNRCLRPGVRRPIRCP